MARFKRNMITQLIGKDGLSAHTLANRSGTLRAGPFPGAAVADPRE